MAYKYLNEDGLKAYTKKVKGALKDLHTPIAISTLNTTESKAQNVRNITDFVAKAKAAGIADVDGMAVTCLLSSGYSGVGYLHFVDGNYTLQGVEIQEELERSTCFLVWDDGSYKNTNLITGDVTSQDLTRGARKPIILTLDTTEVDEETYQKLLVDNVDVVFKLQQQQNATFVPLVLKIDKGSVLEMRFALMIQYFPSFLVEWFSACPHTCHTKPTSREVCHGRRKSTTHEREKRHELPAKEVRHRRHPGAEARQERIRNHHLRRLPRLRPVLREAEADAELRPRQAEGRDRQVLRRAQGRRRRRRPPEGT